VFSCAPPIPSISFLVCFLYIFLLVLLDGSCYVDFESVRDECLFAAFSLLVWAAFVSCHWLTLLDLAVWGSTGRIGTVSGSRFC